MSDDKIHEIQTAIALAEREINSLRDKVAILSRKLDKIDCLQGRLTTMVNEFTKNFGSYMEEHKDDSKKAFRGMVKLAWGMISAGLVLSGSIISFIAYQNAVITEQHKITTQFIQQMHQQK